MRTTPHFHHGDQVWGYKCVTPCFRCVRSSGTWAAGSISSQPQRPSFFAFSGNLHFLIKPTLISVTERRCDWPSHVRGALSERRTPKYVASAVCIISPSYHQTHLTRAKQPPTPPPWTGRQQPPPVYTFTCCLHQPIRSRNREADFGGT